MTEAQPANKQPEDALPSEQEAPVDEFDNERFFDKDNDDLEFLTDEEKTVVINKVLNDIKAEFINLYPTNQFSLNNVLKLINKYRGD